MVGEIGHCALFPLPTKLLEPQHVATRKEIHRSGKLQILNNINETSHFSSDFNIIAHFRSHSFRLYTFWQDWH